MRRRDAFLICENCHREVENGLTEIPREIGVMIERMLEERNGGFLVLRGARRRPEPTHENGRYGKLEMAEAAIAQE